MPPSPRPSPIEGEGGNAEVPAAKTDRHGAPGGPTLNRLARTARAATLSPTLLRPDADEDALARERWSLRGFEARERPRLQQVALSLGRNLPHPPAPDIEPASAARPDPLHPWTWGRPPVLEGGGAGGGGGRIDLWKLFGALPGLLQADPRPKDHRSNEPDTNPAPPLDLPPSEADDTGLHGAQVWVKDGIIVSICVGLIEVDEDD